MRKAAHTGRLLLNVCVVTLLLSWNDEMLLARAFQPSSGPRNFARGKGPPSSGSGTFQSLKKPPSLSSSPSSLSVLNTAFSALDAFWQSSPYTAVALVCAFKASAADFVAQKRDVQKRQAKLKREQAQNKDNEKPLLVNFDDDNEEVSDAQDKQGTDWKRNFAFVLYGALYQGVTQEFVYNHLYPILFGKSSTATVVLKKVLFDLLIQTTCVTLPIAYLTKSIIYRYSFKEAIRRYRDDIRNHGLLKKYYLLWGPVQCVTFSIVPQHWRVTFIACVSFFWLIILSSIASKNPIIKNNTNKKALIEAVVDEECIFEDGLTCNMDG